MGTDSKNLGVVVIDMAHLQSAAQPLLFMGDDPDSESIGLGNLSHFLRRQIVRRNIVETELYDPSYTLMIPFEHVAEYVAHDLATCGNITELRSILGFMTEAQKTALADILLWKSIACKQPQRDMVEFICRELHFNITQRGITWAFAEGAAYKATPEILRVLFNYGARPSLHDGPVLGRAQCNGRPAEVLEAIKEMIAADKVRRHPA